MHCICYGLKCYRVSIYGVLSLTIIKAVYFFFLLADFGHVALIVLAYFQIHQHHHYL